MPFPTNSNPANCKELFAYEGNLPNTSGAWANIGTALSLTTLGDLYEAGSYARQYLSAYGSGAFDVRVVQGRVRLSASSNRSLAAGAFEKMHENTELTVETNTVQPVKDFQTTHVWSQVQIKTSGTVTEVTISVTGRSRT